MKAVICSLLCIMLLTTSAFAGDKVLRLPNALQRIEDEAFFNDSSISDVILPSSVTSIGTKAFANSSLRHINLPENIEFIADDAFDGCTLEYVEAQGDYCRKWCKEHNIKIYEPDPNETEINTDF